MGSPIDSSSPSMRDGATGGALLTFGFGGYSRKETDELFPAVGYVADDYRAFLAAEHLPALAAQTPEATGPSRLPGSSRLDKLYEPHFRQLDFGLAQQLIVPSSVTQGYVPALDVLDVKAEGGVVFGSVLVERKAGVRK